MTEMDLHGLLSREHNQVDWKRTGNPEDIAETLAAFANDYAQVGGGYVICGVTEERGQEGQIRPRVTGLRPGQIRELRDKVFQGCRQSVHPPVVPQFSEVPISGAEEVAVLLIWTAATDELHEYKRRLVIRLDDKTCAAAEAQRRELVLRKGNIDWLERPCPGAARGDLSLLALEEFLGHCEPQRPVEDFLDPAIRFVESARPLTTREHRPLGPPLLIPNRFALLLFGREPTRFLPGAFVSLLKFDSTTRDRPHFTEALFHGPVPKLVADIMGQLQGELGIVVDKTRPFHEGEQNRARYATQVLQEALVNALVHRNYQDGNSTKIAVFTDRIEFENPGGPPSGGDSIAALRKGRTRWRNPSLARYMVKLGLAQEAGSGIPLIEEQTRLISGRSVELQASTDWFRLTIPAYQPRRASPSGAEERSGPTRAGRAGLIVISVGPGNIHDEVMECAPTLGLTDAQVVSARSFKSIESPAQWLQCARELRDELRPKLQDSRFRSFHLFYKGPVVLPALVGALLRGEKPLTLYYHDATGYHAAYTMDKKFLNEEE